MTITYKTGKNLKVETTSASIDGNTISQYLKLGGTGTYSELSVQFTTTASAKITVYYAAGTAGKYVKLLDSDCNVLEISTTPTEGSTSTMVSYTFDSVEAGSYAIASTNSSVYIYAIVIEY